MAHAGGCYETGSLSVARAGGRRGGEARSVGVESCGVIGAEAEVFEGARIRHQLGLPAVIGLVLLHCIDGGGIPVAIRIGGQVVLANEGLLNLGDAIRLNGLLAARAMRTASR